MKKKVKGGKFKGAPSKFKTKAKFVKQEKKPNKDVYNKADDSMDKLVKMNGSMGRKKYGVK